VDFYVSRVYNVSAILWLRDVVGSAVLWPVLNVLSFYFRTFRSTCTGLRLVVPLVY